MTPTAAGELPAVHVGDHQAEAVLFIQDGSFDLLDEDAEPDLTIHPDSNGLADHLSGGVLVTTGIAVGAVAVRVEGHTRPPAAGRAQLG